MPPLWYNGGEWNFIFRAHTINKWHLKNYSSRFLGTIVCYCQKVVHKSEPVKPRLSKNVYCNLDEMTLELQLQTDDEENKKAFMLTVQWAVALTVSSHWLAVKAGCY